MSFIVQEHDPEFWAEHAALGRLYTKKRDFRQLRILHDLVLQREAEILTALEAESAGVVLQNYEEAAVSLERIADLGLSPEGGSMASAETMQTMRASGGFTLPSELKSFLPLILGFLLLVFVILKK